MENSFRFFTNTACRYFPCHRGIDEHSFNCLFCFCPLYLLPDCGGSPQWLDKGGNKGGGKNVKDCSHCLRPHRPEGYDEILAALREALR